MKRHPQSFRLMLASAIALATLVTTAIPVAQAQGDQPPAATPIPLPENPSEVTKAEPTAVPATAESASPQATDAIIWTPDSGSLTINAVGQATVRVATTTGTLDPNSAKFVLVVNGVPQADQSIVGQPVGSNATLDLVATGLNGVNTGTTRILFKVNISGGGTQESAIFNLTRNSRLGLAVLNRDAGVTSIPQTIAQTASSPCDAITNRRGGPLGAFLRYTVSGTNTDSWFFATNTIAGASIVVSLTNYTNVAGQLQMVVESAGGCGGTQSLLGFGTNPNPVVVANNVPRGNIFFRVVSGSGQPAPAAYTIGWGFNRGGGGGGGSGSEIEPNNNTCQATPLPERAVFTANDNDQFDFYSITITQSGQILLLMENHNTVGTQVQVRAPVRYNGIAEADCQSSIPAGLRKDPYVEPIGNVTSVGARVLSRAGGLVFPGGVDGDTAGVLATPQTWFIRVATPNASGQSNKQYTIRWVFLPPGVTTYPFADKMTQSGPARGSDPLLRAGDPFDTTAREKWYYSFFWANMDKFGGGAADAIQVRLDSFSLDGCPNAQFPPDPSRTVPTGFSGNWVTVSNQPSGVMTWKMNKSGAYKVSFRALRGGTVMSSDEKPLRVDCGFTIYNFGGLWPLSNETATPGSPLIGPEKPFDWVEPIP